MVHPSSSGAFLPLPAGPCAAVDDVLVVYTRGPGGWSATSPDIPGFTVAGYPTLPACSTAAMHTMERTLPPSTPVTETAPGATAADWFPAPGCADCGCGQKRKAFFAMVAARLAAGEPAWRVAAGHGLPVEAVESIAAAERGQG